MSEEHLLNQIAELQREKAELARKVEALETDRERMALVYSSIFPLPSEAELEELMASGVNFSDFIDELAAELGVPRNAH